MGIKLKLQELLNARTGLDNVLKTKLPIKAAYHLGKLATKVNAEYKRFDDENRKLVMDLGTEVRDKDGNGTGTWQVSPERVKEYNEQLTALVDYDVEINLDPLKVDLLGDKVELAPADLAACERFIVDAAPA